MKIFKKEAIIFGIIFLSLISIVCLIGLVSADVSYRYVKWEVVEKKGVEGSCVGQSCIQTAEFVLLLDNNTVSWPGGTTATNPGGANPAGEGPGNAIDGSIATKWLDYNFNPTAGQTIGNANLSIDVGSGNTVLFNGYKWSTANDVVERDPISWVLYGSDDGSTWVELDTKNSQTITDSRNTYTTNYQFIGSGDTTPPSITIDSPINGTTYNLSSVDLNWSVDENVSWCGYSLDGAVNDTSIIVSSATLVYNSTGSEQNWTVPAGVTSIDVKVWGAGGGGGWYSSDTYSWGGGAGGFSNGTLSVTPGEVLKIVVGVGGINTSSYSGGGIGGYLGGGNGTEGDASGAGGGGLSGIFTENVNQASSLIIAGGGGGGTGWYPGGPGGGTKGGSCRTGEHPSRASASCGAGGNQTSGGNLIVNGADGSALKGGDGDLNGALYSGTSDGGGGGSGYFGGEGGQSDATGAGGGSGYLNASRITNGNTYIGDNSTNSASSNPAGTDDSDYIYGTGIGGWKDVGGNGSVVISYTVSSGSTPTNKTLTSLSEGSHSVIIYCNDSSGNLGQSSLINFSINTAIPDTSYPTFSNYWDNNASLSNSGIGLFNVTLTSTNGTVLLEINNSNYTATNLTALVYNVSVNFTLNGTYTYRWHSWGNGSSANYNVSEDKYYTVNFSDTTSPVINLISPINNSGQDSNMTFNYNVTEIHTVSNCSLILKGVTNQTNTSITKNITQNFTLNNLTVGNYNWSINCTDNSNNVGGSETRIFSIVKKNYFSGNTTNLSNENINNITNLIIEIPNFGQINFTQSVDLSSGADIDEYVNISFNRIEINSTALNSLNKSAKLKIYNLTFTTPQILKDNVLCSSTVCTQENYTSGTLTFNVTSFSIYSARETPSTSGTGNTGGGDSWRISKTTNKTCLSSWNCTSWSFCSANFTQSRLCIDLNECKNKTSKPTETRTCPDILFDSIVDLKTKKLYPWRNDLEFKVNLIEINTFELVDIKIIYQISKNDMIVYEESETRSIKEEIVYEKKISDLDLPAGEYTFSTIIEYGKNQTASSKHSFSIMGSTNLIIYGIIFVLAILLGFIWYNLYKSRNKTEELEDKLEDIEDKLEKKQIKKSQVKKWATGSKDWIIEKIEAVRLRSLKRRKEEFLESEDLIKRLKS